MLYTRQSIEAHVWWHGDVWDIRFARLVLRAPRPIVTRPIVPRRLCGHHRLISPNRWWQQTDPRGGHCALPPGLWTTPAPALCYSSRWMQYTYQWVPVMYDGMEQCPLMYGARWWGGWGLWLRHDKWRMIFAVLLFTACLSPTWHCADPRSPIYTMLHYKFARLKLCYIRDMLH